MKIVQTGISNKTKIFLERMINSMRLCDVVDSKSTFMEKTDLSEKEIQTIIDNIPIALMLLLIEVMQLKNNPTFKDISMNRSSYFFNGAKT